MFRYCSWSHTFSSVTCLVVHTDTIFMHSKGQQVHFRWSEHKLWKGHVMEGDVLWHVNSSMEEAQHGVRLLRWWSFEFFQLRLSKNGTRFFCFQVLLIWGGYAHGWIFSGVYFCDSSMELPLRTGINKSYSQIFRRVIKAWLLPSSKLLNRHGTSTIFLANTNQNGGSSMGRVSTH